MTTDVNLKVTMKKNYQQVLHLRHSLLSINCKAVRWITFTPIIPHPATETDTIYSCGQFSTCLLTESSKMWAALD